MRYVILLILGICVIFAGLSFLDKSPKEKVKTDKPVKEKILKKKEPEVPVVQTKEDLSKLGFEPVLKDEELSINVKEWSLKGSQRNILVIIVEVKNLQDESVKGLYKKISCKAYKDDKFLGSFEETKEFNVASNSSLDFEVSMGYVDIDTNKVECEFLEYEPKKYQPSPNVFKKEESKKTEDIPLPKLF